ncbi:MAG: rod shape-determining protein RodA [Spirochaetaceae bacterium]|jgi:rod shape determining protein RodA|nr:rod shape-determining protein RodA [Spirochaetaceae bacterium]
MKVRNFLEIDFTLLLTAILLTVFGILFIYSSGVTSTMAVVSNEYMRQIIWGTGGLMIALVLAMINYRRFYDLSLSFYLGTLALLLYTCLFGRLVNGARAWIGIGAIGIQPSEFAKVTTILFLARYLDASKRNKNAFSRFFLACIIVFIPMGLVLMQPDFGTSLVFIPILLAMTFVAGVGIRYVVFLGACIVLIGVLMVLPLWQTYIMGDSLPSLAILANIRFVGITIAGLGIILAIAFFGYLRFKKQYFYWIVYCSSVLIVALGASLVSHKVLKDYQIMRLIVFLDPNVDPRGSGWNIIQSITAIGSGGLWGKGYLQGTQSHYRFLPQQSTDFIFSIFSEEWGFVGGIIVFTLFLLICLRLIRIMKTSSDPFGIYIAAGLSAMYSFHFLVNVGMTMGIMPITGIPLPFMSYGGSSITSAMAGIGLALSIYMRRYRH